MVVSIYNIKKWTKMICGKSVMHVNQGLGKVIEIDKINGYYNDLTEKVTKDLKIKDTLELPMNNIESGESLYFPIQIFQYGLGAYDLFLETKDEFYLKKFYRCVDWAMDNQLETGAWDNFSFLYPKAPYSSMAQGEGCSLLARAFIDSSENKYKLAALKAIDFMVETVDNGGTTRIIDGDCIYLEYTNQSVVLNGWIFSIFGLWDAAILDSKYEKTLLHSIDSLKKYLPKFNLSYWSLYDLSGKITSPFYHKLHIAQMEALYLLTSDSIFKLYADRWQKNYNSKLLMIFAFIKKAYQKILER